MKAAKNKPERFLKLKMFFFKLHYIFIYIVFRPRRIYVSKSAKKQYKARKTPLIYAYNHVGYYDGLTIWNVFIRRYIRFLAFEEISKKKASKFFFAWNGLILIPRESFSLQHYRTIINAVNRGYSLGIAPEGHINRGMMFFPFQTGTAKIALHTKTDIIPLYYMPHRRIFWQKQHIHVGEIIDVRTYKDAAVLTKRLQYEMEALRFNAFFAKKSYVFVLPFDENIAPQDVRFKFFEKYNKESAQHAYHASKAAWFYLDEVLQKRFGLKLSEEDIKFTKEGKPYSDIINFNISHSHGLIALVISKDICSVDIEYGSRKKVKAWTQKEARHKLGEGASKHVKTRKYQHSNEQYYLSVIAASKLKFYTSITL